MMEPISALSLACNVLQLVEQAIDAARACKQIYDRGSLEQNDNLEQLAEAVTTANKDLTHELTRNHSVRNVRVTQLAREATETALELQKVLNNIKFAKGPGNGFSRVFKQTIRSLIKRGTIERVETRLKNQEKALRSGLIKAIYISCGQAEVMQSTAFARLEDGQQAIISRFVDGNSRLFNSIVSQVRQSEASIIASQSASTREIMKAVSQVTTTVTEKNDQRLSLEARKQLLDSLYFEALNQRQDFIETRVGDFGKTFQWIFHDDAKHDFTKWLRDSTGIYWINGLAASGKSSLMAFIYRQVKVEGAKILQDWAKPRSVRILSFFFYKASNDALLKTFSGFWRSLCYQLLCQDETLFGRYLADENAPTWLKSALTTVLSHLTCTNYDLREVFFCLLHHATRTANYFVLVDGLDEFVDNQEQLVDAIEQVMHIAADSIKICCSSRPETLFQHRLKLYPSLQLQKLTEADMLDFCERQLGGTCASSLIKDIVWKAQGVFLWLYLVVNDLRKASFHDSLEELQDRLEECPNEMKGLFSLMLERGDPFYLKRPKPYLRLVYTATTQDEGITLLDLAFADLPQEQLLQELSKRPNHTILHQLSTRAEGLEAQILARTAGLVHFCHNTDYLSESELFTEQPNLESAACLEAQFIHRTALDFLKEEQEGQDVLKACCMSELDAIFTILRARAAFVCASEGNFDSDWLHRVLEYAMYLDGIPEDQPQHPELLDTMFASVLAEMPDCRTQAEDFAVSARKKFRTSSSISPTLSSLQNLAMMVSAKYGLFSYAYQKVSRLPTAQMEVALAVLFSNIGESWPSEIYSTNDYSASALAGIVDLSVPLLSSSQACHLLRCVKDFPEKLPCLVAHTTISPLRDYVLEALITLGPHPARDFVQEWLPILEPLFVVLRVPEGSEVHCWPVFPPSSERIYLFTKFYSGEIVRSANSSSYCIFDMSILRQESLSRNFWDGGEGESKSFSPSSIEVSPTGTERFFALSSCDAEDVVQAVFWNTGPLGKRGDFWRVVEERVLSANMSSFTEEEIGNLVNAGWTRTDDGFTHEDDLSDESGEDLSEAEEDLSLSEEDLSSSEEDLSSSEEDLSSSEEDTIRW
jgi:hypothetical protein